MTKAKFDAKRVMNGTWGELWIEGVQSAGKRVIQPRKRTDLRVADGWQKAYED